MTASASPSCRMRTGRAVCPTGTCPALHSRVVPQGPGLSQPPSPGRTLRRLPGTRASGGPWGGAEAPAVPTVVGAAAEETEPSRADSALVRWRRLPLRHRRAGAQESGARHHKVLRAHELHESVVGRASSAPGTRARATGGGTSDQRRHGNRPRAAGEPSCRAGRRLRAESGAEEPTRCARALLPRGSVARCGEPPRGPGPAAGDLRCRGTGPAAGDAPCHAPCRAHPPWFRHPPKSPAFAPKPKASAWERRRPAARYYALAPSASSW